MTDMNANGRLAGKVAVVTGASRGIGAAVAEAFAAEGAHIIAVARTVGGLEELDDRIQAKGGTTTLVPLDLKDTASLLQLGGALLSRFGHVDLFVANAGILGTLSPIAQSNPKPFQEVMDVNFWANYHLLRTLDPLLRQAPNGGRVLAVTDPVGSAPKAYWNAYAISKAALESMIQLYGMEAAAGGVSVELITPPPTRTRLREDAYPGEDTTPLPEPESVVEMFIEAATR